MAWAESAPDLYKKGRSAESDGRLVEAYVFYSEAAVLDPSNPVYARHSRMIESLGVLPATSQAAEPAAAEPTGSAEDALIGSISPVEMEETQRLLPPPTPQFKSGAMTFDIRGDSKLVFEQIARNCGVELVWELDYQPTPPYHFTINDADCRTALRAAEESGNSFAVPISEHILQIARDTPQKRTELEPTVAKAIPIPERASVQEVQEVLTAIQQSLEIRRIVLDPLKRLIFMRDRAARVRAASVLLFQIVGYRPQIAMELDYLSVDKSRSLSWGTSIQNSFSLANFGGLLHSVASTPAGFTKFLTFGGGQTLFGIGIADALVTATATQSDAHTLLKTQIVALDGQPTTLHIGQKYPILTNGYFGQTEGTGTVYTPPPTFNFEDLGLVLKVTPVVHDMGEVTLDLDAEFKVLGSGTSNGIPIINDRKFQGKVRVRTGEWAVITGLISETNSRGYNGYAGVDRFPFLSAILGQNKRDKQVSDVVIVIKPHVIGTTPWEKTLRPVWVGTETRTLDLL